MSESTDVLEPLVSCQVITCADTSAHFAESQAQVELLQGESSRGNSILRLGFINRQCVTLLIQMTAL